MKPTIPLGRFAGIPIGAHWSVLVTVVLMAQLLAMSVLPEAAPHHATVWYWLAGAAAALLFFVSLLGHEVSHALLARHFGIRIKRITLWLLGGATELQGDPQTPRAEGLIAVVGPLASLGLGGLFLLGGYLAAATGVPTLIVVSVVWLAVANLMLGVFNLLPGAPLDGGRVLRALLWKRYGDRARANRATAGTGQLLGLMIGGFGLAEVLMGGISGLWLVLLGWFMASAAVAERVNGPVSGQLARIQVHEVMTPNPVTLPGWWTVAALIESMRAEPPRARVFPVVDFDGRPVGVVSLAQLAKVPEAARLGTRVQNAGRALDHTQLVSPDMRLTEALSGWRPRTDTDVALVLSAGRLLGMLTPEDLARTVELVTLTGPGRAPAPGAADPRLAIR
jgi:Zn-dependent protease